MTDEKKSVKVTVEHVPNAEVRIFHVNRKICNKSIVHKEGISELMSETREIGEVGTQILQQMFQQVDGLEEVFVKYYSVSIKISRMFDWQKIEMQVINLMISIIEEYEKKSVTSTIQDILDIDKAELLKEVEVLLPIVRQVADVMYSIPLTMEGIVDGKRKLQGIIENLPQVKYLANALQRAKEATEAVIDGTMPLAKFTGRVINAKRELNC